jgi:hypothetical protein
MIAQINDWVDDEGKPAGKSIGLSPHLCILVPSDTFEPPTEAITLEKVCGKCGESIRTWPFDSTAVPRVFDVFTGKVRDSGPVEEAFSYLACQCLVIGYSQINVEEILAQWKGFRRVKHQALSKDQKSQN